MTPNPPFDIKFKLVQANLLSKKPLPANEDLLISCVTAATLSAATDRWRNFFLTDFSQPFLSRIAFDLFGQTWRYIQGDYYMFISPTGGNNSTPYYKVSLFERKRHAMLRTYLSLITTRYFYDKKQAEAKRSNATLRIDDQTNVKVNFSGSEVVENAWYALLLYEGGADSLSANDLQLMQKLKNAIDQLPRKEKMVIEMTYFEHSSGDEIYEELLLYKLISPKRDVESLNNKDKQTAVSAIRKQALKHLKAIMK